MLHNLLEDAEKNGKDNIVSWQPSGRAFKVHKREEFMKTILPNYCRQNHFKSFIRQLNLWDFTLIHLGPDKGSYYHDLFIKGQESLCSKMNRSKKNIKKQQQNSTVLEDENQHHDQLTASIISNIPPYDASKKTLSNFNHPNEETLWKSQLMHTSLSTETIDPTIMEDNTFNKGIIGYNTNTLDRVAHNNNNNKPDSTVLSFAAASSSSQYNTTHSTFTLSPLLPPLTIPYQTSNNRFLLNQFNDVTSSSPPPAAAAATTTTTGKGMASNVVLEDTMMMSTTSMPPNTMSATIETIDSLIMKSNTFQQLNNKSSSKTIGIKQTTEFLEENNYQNQFVRYTNLLENCSNSSNSNNNNNHERTTMFPISAAPSPSSLLPPPSSSQHATTLSTLFPGIGNLELTSMIMPTGQLNSTNINCANKN